jgi:hypothetical protein
MPDPDPNQPLDPYADILGLELPPERLTEVLEAFRGVLEEIRKLRGLDLTDIHPSIIFEPTAAYRKEPGG